MHGFGLEKMVEMYNLRKILLIYPLSYDNIMQQNI